jgi:Ca2+-binding RTX toxin-like protein
LVGGADADSLNGGLGDGTLVVNNDVALGERYDGGGGADVLLIRSDTNLGVVTVLNNIDTITLLDNVDVIFSAAALSGETLAITGTSGIDTLIGGDGNDAFRFSSSTQTGTSNTPSQMDVISDFNILDDQINLLDMGAASAPPSRPPRWRVAMPTTMWCLG